MAFEYKHDGKRLENMTPEMLDSLARQLNISRASLNSQIALQVFEAVMATHVLGYAGNNTDGWKISFDHHLGNFRLYVQDGRVKVILVGDFGNFRKVEQDRTSFATRSWDILKVSYGEDVPGLMEVLALSYEEIFKLKQEAFQNLIDKGDSPHANTGQAVSTDEKARQARQSPRNGDDHASWAGLA